MGVSGMDIEAVRELGRRLKSESLELQDRINYLTRIVREAECDWHGPDSARLQDEWTCRLRPGALRAADGISEFAARAARNANAQEQVSSSLNGGNDAAGSA